MPLIMDQLDFLLKLVIAAVLGGMIGWQREARDRPAGLRTHILVCVGSAIYTLASISFGPRAYSDPARIAAQVAAGMGFLGAGTIIRHGSEVKGLTTAASLWSVAAIGICVGLGGKTFGVAILGTIVVFLTLTVLRQLEVRHIARPRYSLMTLEILGDAERIGELQKMLAKNAVQIESLHMLEKKSGEAQKIQIGVRLPAEINLVALLDKVSDLQGFLSARCD